MIKKVAIGAFVVVFTIFALNYYKLLPSNRTLAFDNLSYRQEETIKKASVVEKTQQSNKFTDRHSKKPFIH